MKKLLFLFAALCCMMVANAQDISNNQIWYTTSDNEPIEYGYDEYKSNEFDEEKGMFVLEIEEDITEIDAVMFCEGYMTLTSVIIPASVTSIGEYAFYDCSSLTTVTFAEGSKLSTIANEAFVNCGLTSITIPASVTSIGDSAFPSCSSLVTVTFEENSQLSTIGASAFENCTSLESITIPVSVTSIGTWAFLDCSGLTSVTVFWTESLPTTGSGVFDRISSNATLLVPAGTEDLYATNESWSGYNDYMKPYITANQDPNNKKDYYATFYSSSKAYKLPEDVTAYTGAVDGSVLKLTPITDNIIPAGEGVVLKLTSTDDTETKVHFLVEESEEAGTKDPDNALTGTDVEYTATQYDYALSSGKYGVGFYPFWEKTIGAHKAYLTLGGSAGAKAFIFQFDDATSIHNSQFIIHNSEIDVMYNLNGVRVNDGYKGIVIKNGKKYYNK